MVGRKSEIAELYEEVKEIMGGHPIDYPEQRAYIDGRTAGALDALFRVVVRWPDMLPVLVDDAREYGVKNMDDFVARMEAAGYKIANR